MKNLKKKQKTKITIHSEARHHNSTSYGPDELTIIFFFLPQPNILIQAYTSKYFLNSDKSKQTLHTTNSYTLTLLQIINWCL
jgi:hypothetical protein